MGLALDVGLMVRLDRAAHAWVPPQVRSSTRNQFLKHTFSISGNRKMQQVGERRFKLNRGPPLPWCSLNQEFYRLQKFQYRFLIIVGHTSLLRVRMQNAVGIVRQTSKAGVIDKVKPLTGKYYDLAKL